MAKPIKKEIIGTNMLNKIEKDNIYKTLIDIFTTPSSAYASYLIEKFVIDLKKTLIKINNPQDILNENFWNRELLGVFWHEYIHYFQYVATPAGVVDFLKRSELMKSFGQSWIEIKSFPSQDRALYDGTSFFYESREEFYKYIDVLYGSIDRPSFVNFRNIGDETYGASFLVFKGNWIKLTSKVFFENMAQAIENNIMGNTVLPSLERNEKNARYYAIANFLNEIIPNNPKLYSLTIKLCLTCLLHPMP